MKPYDTPSKTSDAQTDHETRDMEARNIAPVFNDDTTQLDVAIIHQIVVDALSSCRCSSAVQAPAA